MLKIRLSRLGTKNKPLYRIVVIDKRLKKSGRPKCILGFWNPKKDNLKFDAKLYKDWVAKGAITSVAVKNLINPKNK